MTLGLLFCVQSSLAGGETPENGWIVWSSNREDGRHELYLSAAAGASPTRITFNGGKYPIWSPDGRWIAYVVADTATVLLPFSEHPVRVVRRDGSEDKQIFTGVAWFWIYDGSGVVCSDREGSFYVVDPDTSEKTLLFKKSDFPPFAEKELWPGGLTRDGRWMVAATDRYLAGYDGTNGSFKANLAAVILDMADRDKVYYLNSGCMPTTSPTGSLVYHVRRDSETWPDLYAMDLADVMTRSSYQAVVAYEDADWGHEYFPRVSTDGKWLIYSAADSCHNHDLCDYDLFVHRIGAAENNRLRVVQHPSNDQWPHMFVGDPWSPEQRPALTATPGSLSFETPVGDDPDPQQVEVTNTADGTLALVTVKAAYEGEGEGGWLRLTTSGTGNSQTVVNTIKAQGLPPGTYRAVVTVEEVSATNSPTYEVSLLVQDPGGCGCRVERDEHPVLAEAVMSMVLVLCPFALVLVRRRRVRPQRRRRPGTRRTPATWPGTRAGTG